MEPSWHVLGPEPARFGPAPGQYRNRLIVHAAANAQRAVDLILGTTFEQEREASGNAGDAAVSGNAVAMNIGSAVYRHAHL